MNDNPFQSPEHADSTEPPGKSYFTGMMLIQVVLCLATIFMFFFWIPYLEREYARYGIELSVLSRNLLNYRIAYLLFCVVMLSISQIPILVCQLRKKAKRERNWTAFRLTCWMLFLAYIAVVAYSPVFAIRSGGVDVWL